MSNILLLRIYNRNCAMTVDVTQQIWLNSYGPGRGVAVFLNPFGYRQQNNRTVHLSQKNYHVSHELQWIGSEVSDCSHNTGILLNHEKVRRWVETSK